MIKLNISETTVKHNLCCGCGICSVACPEDAIKIRMDENKQYKPTLSSLKCNHCGRCLQVCPFSEKAVIDKCKKISHQTDYGIRSSVSLFKGVELSDNYVKSSSGGLLSALLKYLIDEKKVDCVIHAEQLYSEPDNSLIYFRACISRSAEEIDNRRGSFYYPVEFSDVLQDVLADVSIRSCCIVAVPCVLQAVSRLKTINRNAAQKIIYSFALICSHNVNGQFAAKILDDFGIRDCKTKITFRDKVGIDSAENFNQCIKCEEDVEYRKSRFLTSFTIYWRNYAYSLNSCFYCSDFLGVYADASFKDAWELPTKFKNAGETVVICHNPVIQSFLKEMKSNEIIAYEYLNAKQVLNSQYETLQFKSILSPLRLKKKFSFPVKTNHIPFFIKCTHWIELKLKRLTAEVSNRRYREKKLFIPKYYLYIVNIFHSSLTRLRVIYAKLMTRRDYRSENFEVLYTAGFGYDNLGDEAQLGSNITNWKRLKPGCKITVLSPNPDLTRMMHGQCEVIHAARRSLWSGFNIDYFGIGDRTLYMPLFLIKLLWVVINSILYKYLRITLMSPISAYLLYKLKTADVLHIGGGGFLTGKTASRLYDNMALIWLAHFFNTEVILSGHNIGIWQNPLQKLFARQLRKARYIGLRDGENSVRDLKKIGVYSKDKVFVLFDDALFCPPASLDRLWEEFQKIGFDKQPYITLHVHYWNVPLEVVNEALVTLASVLDEIYGEFSLPYVLVPMIKSDLKAMIYLKERMASPVYVFDSSNTYNLAVAAYHNATICITMKHHPIIFSMAGAVPTISFAFEEYYFHKNYGAMKLFGQKDNMYMVDAVYDGRLKNGIHNILNHRQSISKEIKQFINQYQESSGKIIKLFLDHIE